MFRPLPPGHHQVTSKWNLRKLDTVIYESESHRIKMQRDLVVILYDSIYNQYKIVKT
jgi:phage gp45-like